MSAPERITVTVDRHGEPIVFGADLNERALINGCAAIDYARADLVDALEDALLRLHRGEPRSTDSETVRQATLRALAREGRSAS